jgi:molybdate transport system regulatory protein
MADMRLTVRVDFGSDRVLGPGKIRLLEAIKKSGSISQAGRLLDMSYRRAWELVDQMNHCFREPVVAAQPGGSRGGGASLTTFGERLIEKYRRIETQATAAAQPQLRALMSSLRYPTRAPHKPRKTSSRVGSARRGAMRRERKAS